MEICFWSHYNVLLGLPLWPHKHDISVSVMLQLQQEGQQMSPSSLAEASVQKPLRETRTDPSQLERAVDPNLLKPEEITRGISPAL